MSGPPADQCRRLIITLPISSDHFDIFALIILRMSLYGRLKERSHVTLPWAIGVGVMSAILNAILALRYKRDRERKLQNNRKIKRVRDKKSSTEGNGSEMEIKFDFASDGPNVNYG